MSASSHKGGAKRRDGTKYGIATLALLRMGFGWSALSSASATATCWCLSHITVSRIRKMYVFKDGAQITNINGTVNSYLNVFQFDEDEIPEMNWVQSADTVIMVHEDMPPTKIVRGATTALDCQHNLRLITSPNISLSWMFTVHSSRLRHPLSVATSPSLRRLLPRTMEQRRAGGASTITLKSSSTFTADDQANGMYIELTGWHWFWSEAPH